LKPALLLIGLEAKPQTQILPFLEAAGWQVHGPSDGPQALELARERQPCVILIQSRAASVPNGLHICQDLRADQRTNAIPILIVSALGAVDDRLDGYRAGADAFLPTPCDFEELFVRLKALLPFRGEGHAMPASAPWEGTWLAEDYLSKGAGPA
jgi:DNA-binding response OmpR family regulator